ncbi:MFS transporter [Amycolatopsis sp. cg5]|uniref:MFS transporter n=1 Tax=Amycolatopsis sp. cg5 TaxID=3238802 RepID=UPI0035246244
MSHSASESRATLADYRTALTAPGSRGPVIASLLARLPIAMVGISALLYVQRETGSFATAGLISAAMLIGVALGAVLQGRLIDRFGPTKPLLITVAVFSVGIAALVFAIESRMPTWVLLVPAAIAGMAEPSVGSASRALWTRLLPPGPARNAAFSYEAISMEVFFVLGPGFAGLLVAAPWAGTGMIIGSGIQVLGTILFALSPKVRSWKSAEKTSRSMLGALASPGMRTLALAVLGFGIVIGFVEVAVPASATNAGFPAMGGLLLSAWSISSVAFGVAYSMRPWPTPIGQRLPVLLGVFAVLVALLALPSNLWTLALGMLFAGALITPQSATHSTMIEVVAPKGTAAEAFGWVLTAVTLGLAFGQSISGYLVEHHGPGSAFIAAGVAGLLVAVALWKLRGTVRPFGPQAEASDTELVGAAA